MLTKAAKAAYCRVHAYVLMPNHVHILASPEHEASPASMMKSVGQRYVQYINRKYGRTGTLWQGRYRSSLVGEEKYFMECQRYIELNPVRASLARHPADYEWSSYRANAYALPSDLVAPHELYLQISADQGERLSAYRALVASAMSEETLAQIRNATNTNFVFGSNDFIDQIRIELDRDSIRRFPTPKSRTD